MKQFILTVLCVACMGFVGCSRGVPEDNSISDNNDIVTVIDCSECRKELNKIDQNYNSAAGFKVKRDSFNHITIE